MRGLFFGGALAGALIGFGLGLALTRSYWPVPIWGATAADLRRDLKDDYIRMIASTYSLDGDMARALQRLTPLKLVQPELYISSLARGESNSATNEAIARLAIDLKNPSAALARPTFTPRPFRAPGETATAPRLEPLPLATKPSPQPPFAAKTAAGAVSALLTPQSQISATPEPIPFDTDTVEPLPTPASNPSNPFYRLKSKDWLNCLATQGRGIIQVDVIEGDGKPSAGIGVELAWDAGDEVFYTGLKPERGIGYADVEVSPGIYSIKLTEDASSPVVDNLRIDAEPEECPGDGSELRGWKIVFQRSE